MENVQFGRKLKAKEKKGKQNSSGINLQKSKSSCNIIKLPQGERQRKKVLKDAREKVCSREKNLLNDSGFVTRSGSPGGSDRICCSSCEECIVSWKILFP